MGHLAGKDIYKDLARKIDGLVTRAPFNGTLYEILKTLYSREEAEIIVKMPYGLANLDRIARSTGREKDALEKILDGLAHKGLVMDVWIRNRYYYIISPMVIGIFEFTMMRTDDGVDCAKMARLFNDYMENSGLFIAANCGSGQKVSPMRTIPWEGTISDTEHIEILDFEKARNIIESNDLFAIGHCSCRHKKSHSEEGACDVNLEKCSVMGRSAWFIQVSGSPDPADGGTDLVAGELSLDDAQRASHVLKRARSWPAFPLYTDILL